ncbi:MAG: hypothetical protein ACLQOO_02855 [Terriglobia bacterium]
MLKPYVFAICEKVVLDAKGTASLIALFNKVEVQILPSIESVPPNAIAVTPWAIFVSWEIEPDDIGKKFLQVFEVFFPDGSLFHEQRIELVPQEGKTHHQIHAQFQAFPIGQQGNYSVKMRLEQDGVKLFESSIIKINVAYRPAVIPNAEV